VIGSRVSTGVAVTVAATIGTGKSVVDCVKTIVEISRHYISKPLYIAPFPIIYAFASIVVNDKYKKNISDK
jgi:hypothetical protein